MRINNIIENVTNNNVNKVFKNSNNTKLKILINQPSSSPASSY